MIIFTFDFGGNAVIDRVREEMGRMFNWSSITMQFLFEVSDNMNLLKAKKEITFSRHIKGKFQDTESSVFTYKST